MPYTSAQLSQYYQSLTGVAPDASTSLLFQAYANQNAGGSLSDAQTLAGVFNSVGVQNTFEVAESTYQFFTGSTTSAAGLAYLEGTAGNANGLTTSYYNGTNGTISAPNTSNGFNTENRYYNFAINLTSSAGAGQASFASSYGSLTFNQTVAAAYENIVGSSNVGTANANAAIADIQSRMGYFQQVAATRGGDATALSNPNASLTLKAVVVGYILEEANKADVGTYAKAIDQFEASVANGGSTSPNANAIYNTNLLQTYQQGGAGYNMGVGATGNGSSVGTGTTVAFTLNTDTFNNSTGNVTFVGQVGTNATLNASDIVNAGGSNNTLLVNVVGGTGDASGGAILNGIQTVDVRVTDGNTAALSQSAVPNATTLYSYLSTGQTTFNNVSGSTTVGITGNGSVQGGSLIANYASGASETVNLAGGVLSAAQAGGGAATNVTINPASLGNTVNLNSTGNVNSIDTLDVSNNYTLNITATQALNVNQITDTALRTLNVTGSGAVNLGATPVNVRTVTSSDTGGLTASFIAPTPATAALSITTAANAVDRITIDNAYSTTVINTGGGGDTIQVTGTINAGASLNGSGGATLAVTSADYTGLSGFSAANRSLITGFSTLAITDAGGLTAGATYDVNLIGAQNFTSTGIAAGTATVNAASGAIITRVGSANFGGTIVVNEAGATAASSTNDSLTLGYTGQTGSGTSNIQIAGVETAQIIANRATGIGTATTLTVNLTEQAGATAALTNVTIAGNERVNFTAVAAETALKSVSAANSTANVTVDVSQIAATGTTGVTLTGGSGIDTLTFKDFAKVTGGASGDFFQAAVTTSGQTYSSILDAQAGDHVSFVAGGAVTSTGTFTTTTQPAAIQLASTAVFQDYLDAATKAATSGDGTNVHYFQFGGNTYLVEGNSGAQTFQNGTDAVVQLAGAHTLAGTSTAGVFLIGS